MIRCLSDVVQRKTEKHRDGQRRTKKDIDMMTEKDRDMKTEI